MLEMKLNSGQEMCLYTKQRMAMCFLVTKKTRVLWGQVNPTHGNNGTLCQIPKQPFC